VASLRFAMAGMALLGFGATLAYASADDAITARQACMKANGKMAGAMAKIFKGETPYDPAAVAAAAAPEETACADWAHFWGPDTMKGETKQTWAKATIWEKPDEFKAVGMDFYNKLQAVKATTDEAGFKAAFAAMGKGCQTCHEQFRVPKE